MQQIDLRHQAKLITDFVRQVFQQFFGIRQSDDAPRIILAYEYATALGIGKTADPFQIIIMPGLLPFDVLRFLRHGLNTPLILHPKIESALLMRLKQLF